MGRSVGGPVDRERAGLPPVRVPTLPFSRHSSLVTALSICDLRFAICDPAPRTPDIGLRTLFLVTRHFSPNYRVICAIPAKKSERLLSIIAQSVHFRVKAVFFAGHFVAVACVFMHIAGSIFIFNISKGQPPVPDLEKHMSAPPPLVKVGIFPSFAIDRLPPTTDSKPLAPRP